MSETRLVEGHVFVTSGNRHCPDPSLCDQRNGETYENYVRRHCLDHDLGEFEDVEDAERNLGVWCLFYCDRYVIGNESIGTKLSAGKHRIIAEYEPCWEDAEFLANWDFDPDDLEQNIEWEERTFMLPPLAQRRPGVYKRMKKETKVRGTQKTSRAKALVTFEHLHQYFVIGNIFFRVLTISGASRLARDHYFKPLKQLWKTSKNIKRLYGAWETRCSCTRNPVYTVERGGNCPLCGSEIDEKSKVRRVGIIGFGSHGTDTITMRWNVASEDSSGMAIVSLMCAGVDTALTGSRWDFIVFDDPHNRKNTYTHEQRQKVKDTHAELRKQLDARGRLLWLNTPWHTEDASQQIDDEFGDEFHILYRPAMWTSTTTGQVCYYWQQDALGLPVWTAARIEAERRQADFNSQVLLRPRNPEDQMFDEKDFVIVDPDRAPLEIRAGRGVEVSEEDQILLAAQGASMRRIIYVDPAGLEERKKYGADTAIVGCGFDRDGNVWVMHINSGRFNASQEREMVFGAWVHTRADIIRVELSGAHQKHVKQSFMDFAGKKSQELGRSIIMPFSWDAVTTSKSKDERVSALHPLVKSGRVKILSDAGPREQIDKFINQLVNFGPNSTLKDLADAFSMVLCDIEVPTWDELDQPRLAAEKMEYVSNDDGTHTLTVPGGLLMEKIAAVEQTSVATSWGLGGRGSATRAFDRYEAGEEF